MGLRNDHLDFARQMQAASAQIRTLSLGLKHQALDEIAEKWAKEVTSKARENLSGGMVGVKTGTLFKSQGYLTRKGKSNLSPEMATILERPSQFGQVTVGNVAEYADLIHNGHGEIHIEPVNAQALRYTLFTDTLVNNTKTATGNWRREKNLEIGRGQGKEVFSAHSVIPASPPKPFLTKAINATNINFVTETNRIIDKYIARVRRKSL